MKEAKTKAIKWPTLGICAICYLGVGVSTAFAQSLGMTLAIVILTLSLTLYSSFNHEVLHGHPFKNATANTVLVFPAMGLFIPYPRFRDTHLAHHRDPSLTDPYDDPETNFIDPAIWVHWSRIRKAVYQLNNTLLGRMIIGPAIGLATFYKQDIRLILNGDRKVAGAYIFHLAGLVPVAVWLIWASELPAWMYLLAVYFSFAILKIRTFLEHRAHEKARCRSVIIEDKGLLSLLFLKNNLHAVHHADPTLPWYKLQSRYSNDRESFLSRNGGYSYRSYWDVARLFLLKPKDPVPHQLWPMPADQQKKILSSGESQPY